MLKKSGMSSFASQVLSRGGAVRGSNIQITADMTRTMREGWGELTKFMARVMIVMRMVVIKMHLP